MYKSYDHLPHPILEHPVHVPLVVLLPGRLLHGLGLHPPPPSPPGRGQVLEHALSVGAEHPVQGNGHGVGPEEVMVECIISIQPLGRVQGKQLINQITGKSILEKDSKLNKKLLM